MPPEARLPLLYLEEGGLSHPWWVDGGLRIGAHTAPHNQPLAHGHVVWLFPKFLVLDDAKVARAGFSLFSCSSLNLSPYY